MNKILVYEAEAKAGLADLIEKNCSVAYVCKVEKCEQPFSKIQMALANDDNELLYATKSILVTTNWNQNDDVFLKGEVWAARHTPIHKPTNIEHNKKEIVGHITDTWAIDFDGNIIPNNTSIEDLPNFHLCNGAVIYRHYPKDDELQTRANLLIEEIEAGEKYVSMECVFPTFDYALRKGKDVKIVKRTAESAFLTKHLRAYGGTGKYDVYEVGRVLRNIEFSGKGYVSKPANPESIIFNNSDLMIVNASLEEIQASIVKIDNNDKERLMDNQYELDQAKKTVAELSQANKDLVAKLEAFEAEKFETQIASFKAEVAKASEEKVGLQEKITVLEKQVADTAASLSEVSKSLEEVSSAKLAAEAKIAAVEAEALKASRVSTLVEGGIEKEAAVAKVEKFVALSDEQFSEVASALVAAFKPAKDTDPITEVETQITEAKVTEVVPTPSPAEDVSEQKQKMTTSIASLLGSYLSDNNEEKGEK